MPDFDTCERLFLGALASRNPEADLPAAARALTLLPDMQTVKLLKARSEADVESFLWRAHQGLRDVFRHEAAFETSEDNRRGKDLREVITDQWIEIKSGPLMTDANVGLSTVAWALESSLEDLRRIMADSMRYRRLLAIRCLEQGESIEDSHEIRASKDSTMEELGEFLASAVSVGEVAPPRLEHFVRCVSVGVTTLEGIQERWSEVVSDELPILLQADWTSGLVEYDKSFAFGEPISVIEAGRTKDRPQILVVGGETGRTARIFPNYKNAWKRNGEKVPASAWVSTACFHVWIDK